MKLVDLPSSFPTPQCRIINSNASIHLIFSLNISTLENVNSKIKTKLNMGPNKQQLPEIFLFEARRKIQKAMFTVTFAWREREKSKVSKK